MGRWRWGGGGGEAVAAIEADVVDGKLFIFLPEVLYRGQPHNTFKFVFNGIFLATAEEADASETLIP